MGQKIYLIYGIFALMRLLSGLLSTSSRMFCENQKIMILGQQSHIFSTASLEVFRLLA
uniref:Uncharacterized protein MANES_07G003200 n=1 Tax=Rhizophora mucronata TaxID=61149 RepID=A0A2P2M9B4_RHIMU